MFVTKTEPQSFSLHVSSIFSILFVFHQLAVNLGILQTAPASEIYYQPPDLFFSVLIFLIGLLCCYEFWSGRLETGAWTFSSAGWPAEVGGHHAVHVDPVAQLQGDGHREPACAQPGVGDFPENRTRRRTDNQKNSMFHSGAEICLTGWFSCRIAQISSQLH